MKLKITWDRDIGSLEKETFENGFAHRKDLPPGHAAWVHAHLRFTCPCGCGMIGALPVFREGDKGDGWKWNGDELNPTTTPSIQMCGPCRWHGFLTAGFFESV